MDKRVVHFLSDFIELDGEGKIDTSRTVAAVGEWLEGFGIKSHAQHLTQDVEAMKDDQPAQDGTRLDYHLKIKLLPTLKSGRRGPIYTLVITRTRRPGG